MLFGQQHVEKYVATAGEIGHEWQPGVYTLLLTTTGRRSGERLTTPLIYTEDDGDYIVIASKGGAPQHPHWYLNLQADPQVEIQVEADVLPATASEVTDERRERLWREMAGIWPDYDAYAERTDRQIPVVALRPHDRR